MQKRVIYTVVFVFALVAVRMVGSQIFYDPLINFFHLPDYQNQPLPEIEGWKYSFSLFARFMLNTLITLGLVQSIFSKPDLVKLTFVLLGLVFVILAPILIWLVFNADFDQYRYLFYIRRILIHPILTLILIPAFLYNDRVSKKE
jgi:exosortase F-associated protein